MEKLGGPFYNRLEFLMFPPAHFGGAPDRRVRYASGPSRFGRKYRRVLTIGDDEGVQAYDRLR